MADENDKPNGGVPPKLDLTKTGPQAKPDAQGQPPTTSIPKPVTKKQTTRIDFSAAAMVPDEKSKTARISLGPIGLSPAATGGPKTIRIQRPSDMPTIKLQRPAPPTAQPAPDAKTKTSRIPLQEALGSAAAAAAEPSAAEAGGPKTIRIKRPDGDVPAAPVPQPAETKSKTARLDVPADAGPPTQRKTIRIKRPDAEADALKEVAVSRAEAPASAEAESDEPGLVFSLLALAAVLVCGVLVYVLAVQALPGLGLSWPGQVKPI